MLYCTEIRKYLHEEGERMGGRQYRNFCKFLGVLQGEVRRLVRGLEDGEVVRRIELADEEEVLRGGELRQLAPHVSPAWRSEGNEGQRER